MTTTQPTEFSNSEGRYLNVFSDRLVIDTKGSGLWTFLFDSPEQACRAALAILTGPGKVVPDESAFARMAAADDAHIAFGAHQIREGLTMKDEAARDEAEAAELDRRAELAYQAVRTPLPALQWRDVAEKGKDTWRDIIRALDADAEARRLHTNKETNHG